MNFFLKRLVGFLDLQFGMKRASHDFGWIILDSNSLGVDTLDKIGLFVIGGSSNVERAIGVFVVLDYAIRKKVVTGAQEFVSVVFHRKF